MKINYQVKQFTWQLFSATGKLFIIWLLIYLSLPLLFLATPIAATIDVFLIILAGKTIKSYFQSSTQHINQSFFPVGYKKIVPLLFSLGLVFLLPIISFPVAKSVYKWMYWQPMHRTGNYTQLSRSLNSKDWQLANRETFALMLEITQRTNQNWLSTRSIETFPCDALQKIDNLWTTASNGKFGFSVQTEIWKKLNGGKLFFNHNVQTQFTKDLGWSLLEESNLDSAKFKSTDFPVGHFPTAIGSTLGKACVSKLDSLYFGQAMGCYQKILIRLEQCNSEKLKYL